MSGGAQDPGSMDALATFDDLPHIFDSLLCNDNERRRLAEAAYYALKSVGGGIVPQLLDVMSGSENHVFRSLAAVLLRRLLEFPDSVYPGFEAEAKAQLRSRLLEILDAEAVPSVQKSVCHTIAELVCTCSEAGEMWPEVVPFAISLVQDATQTRRETGLFLLTKLAEYLGPPMQAYADDITPVLDASLDDASGTIRVAALQATVQLLLCFEGAEIRRFSGALPKLFMTMQAAVDEDELDARSAMESLCDVAHHEPTFLRPVMEEAADAMLSIAQRPMLEVTTRAQALEFLLVLADSAGGMVRKSEIIALGVLTVGLEFMCDADEDPEWGDKEDDLNFYSGESDETDLAQAGQGAVDRVAQALGGNVVYPILKSLVGPLVAHAEWQRRRAGVLGLALAGDGCGPVMRGELTDLIPVIMPLTRDEHPRVRYAAVHALGQLALDLGQRRKKVRNFHDLVGEQVLPCLLESMGELNGSVPRVRGHAAAALGNYAREENCKLKQIEPVEEVMRALYGVLVECRSAEQQQALVAISLVAKLMGERVGEFYDTFVPVAKEIMRSASAEDVHLRGRAMELITCMGESVGRDYFRDDATELMRLVVDEHGQAAHSSMTGGNYTMQSCVRIFKVMGEEFAPFLEHIIPSLLAAAGTETPVFMTDVEAPGAQDDDFEESGMKRTVISIRGYGQKVMSVNAAQVEDKATAAYVLYQYVYDSGAFFLPYLDVTVKTLLSLVNYKYLDGPRSAGICGMPKLLSLALLDDADADHAQRVLMQCLDVLLPALSAEKSIDMLGQMGEALDHLLRIAYESGPPPRCGVALDYTPRVHDAIRTAMRGSLQRRASAIEKAHADDDFDEDSAVRLEQQLEDERDLLVSLQDACGYLTKMHGEAVIESLRTTGLETDIMEMASSGDIIATACAMCMLDDLVEHASPAAHEYLELFMPLVDQGIDVTESLARQAAVYGAGVLAAQGGESVEGSVHHLVGKLANLVQEEDAFDEECINCTENAMSSLLKFVQHRSAGLGPMASDVVDLVVQRLPLVADEMEACVVHEVFFRRVIAGDVLYVGEGWSKLQQVVHAFSAILVAHLSVTAEGEDPLLNEESEASVPAVWAAITAGAAAEAVSAAVGALAEEQQEVLAGLSG